MCGIAGILRTDGPVDQGELDRMTDAMTHRGPDGRGTYIHENVGIGHRRLSFIDLEGGSQPMADVDQNIHLTYNGELYNFQDLRQELEAAGYSFKTRSDTEVIIYAYKHWGVDCLKRFRGMFAIGLVDVQQQRVLIARDQLGIKPVCYHRGRNCFAFASELQAFAQLNDFNQELNLGAIDKYLWLQYIPAPDTAFKNTFKLLPGEFMLVNFQGEVLRQEKFWELNFNPQQGKNANAWMEELDSTLQDSVKKHLVSDVPFGAFLSGGLDSSAVVGYMSKELSIPVKTFSIGFQEKEYSETDYARLVAKEYNTEHYERIVAPNALEVLPTLVKHYGEPFGDSSSVPTYYVCKMASEHVKMVLSGDGGDESMAGYEIYTNWMKYELAGEGTGLKQAAKNAARKLLPSRYPPIHSYEKYLHYIHFLDQDWRTKLWKDEHQEAVQHRLPQFEAHYRKTAEYHYAAKMQYFDLNTYLPNDILTKVDIASMINSLEVRTPMVDVKFWELCAQIPSDFQLSKVKGEWEGKLLLKELLKKVFPYEFCHRPKQGFSMPIKKWFAGEGDLSGYIKERLTGADSPLATYFNQAPVEQLIREEKYSRIWLLLFLDEWLRSLQKTS